MNRNKKLWFFFIAYSIVMLWLLFGQRMGFVSYEDYLSQLGMKINLIPFKTVAEYVEKYQTNVTSLVNHAIINIGGNIGTFIPLGYFLPALFKRTNTLKALFISASVIIVSVEIIQYFTLLGSFDIDDYILNILGVLIGFAIYKLVKKASV